MNTNKTIKKYLKNSDKPENKNLIQKEIQELEEAIQKSKQSAEIEEERRKCRQQAEKAPKSFPQPGSSTNSKAFFEKSETEKLPSPQQRRKQSKSPTDSTLIQEKVPSHKTFFTFEDFIEAPESSLKIVYHPPVFDLPIPTNALYGNLTRQCRSNLMCDYYTKLEALRKKTVTRSTYHAPWPKPILPSDDFAQPSTSGIDKLFEHIPDQQVYVSRAGRQVKRKIYTEDNEGDSDSECFYLTNKKNKADDSDIKITVSKPYIPQARQEVGKFISKIPRARTESPKRAAAKKFTNRSEELFDKLIENEEKKRLEEVEIDDFQKTLPEIGEAEEDKLLWGDDSKEGSEEYFAKKRVSPPIPIKRGERKKRPSKEGPESPPENPVLKRYDNVRKTTPNESKSRRIQRLRDNIPSKPSMSMIQKTPCPLCNQEFLQSKIEKHAANCKPEEDIGSGTNTSAVTSITCERCDQVFLLDADYKNHAKQCVASMVCNL